MRPGGLGKICSIFACIQSAAAAHPCIQDAYVLEADIEGPDELRSGWASICQACMHIGHAPDAVIS